MSVARDSYRRMSCSTSPMDLRPLSGRFRDDAQRQAVRDAVHYRLADDRHEEECRYLMRFWWQLVMSYSEVTLAQLEEHLRAENLAVVLALLDATTQGHEAIDAWLDDCTRTRPIVEDRGFARAWEG